MTDATYLIRATETLNEALLTNGALLITVDPDGRPNPMTIGWGLVGVGVRKPILSIYLSQGGYTHEFIRQAESFTVNIPVQGSMIEVLEICGTCSGREVDKVAEAHLSLTDAQTVSTPVARDCAVAFECTRLRFAERENGDLVVFGQIAAAYARA